MAVDQHLMDELQYLRRIVANVNGASVQLLARNGCGRVETIRASVDQPERFEVKLSALDQAVVRFARLYAQHWMFVQSDETSRRAIDDARETLNAQVDELEWMLDGAELNGEKKWLLYGDASGLNQGRR